MNDQRKVVIYLGSSEKDLAKLPSTVREVFQHGIQMASEGDTHPDAKVLKGFHGRGVLEIIEDHRTDTFRAVYTIKFPGVLYVLHVFKKKSKKGSKTPKEVRELIEIRLKFASQHYKIIADEAKKKR